MSPLQGATCSARWLHASRRSARQDHQQLSWSLLPLRRFSLSKSTPPRVAKPEYVPPTGFRTLSTDYSSLGRLALFRASSAHGVCRSPGGFPHYQRSTDSSPMHNPLDVLPRLHCVLHRNADRSVLAAPPYHIPKNVVAATPPSGHHSSSGSVFHARGFRPTVKSIPS